MYYKDNNKKNSSFYSADDYHFPYYEFSKIQQWLEIGHRLQKIYDLHRKIITLLEGIDSKHGPILTKEYDKVSGYTGGTAKPIKPFIETEEIKYISRLIEEAFNSHLRLITGVDKNLREIQSYKNLIEYLKIFSVNEDVYGTADRGLIENYFDYITLNGLQENLLHFWDYVRKYLDDKTNEISIPQPTLNNREFYEYFLQSRDNYCEGNYEIALAIIRKSIEDVLTRLWILHFDKFHHIDLKKLPNLDNLPGFLKGKNMLTEQEFREVKPFIKYGNSAIHITGEISSEKLKQNAKQMINAGIIFVNTLAEKYIKYMTEKNYWNIEFTKTGLSAGQGKLHECIARKAARNRSLRKEDIPEFSE